MPVRAALCGKRESMGEQQGLEGSLIRTADVPQGTGIVAVQETVGPGRKASDACAEVLELALILVVPRFLEIFQDPEEPTMRNLDEPVVTVGPCVLDLETSL